jgi:CheY-like chemotaxis protein
MPARLLVTDDNSDMRQSMRLLLERAGYEVELADDGLRAVDLQRRRPADVLITDIFMPEADGLETIAHFRREFPRVRIIAMSGGGVRVGGAGSYLQTAAAAGADAVLAKPFQTEALLEAVRRLVPPA